MSEYLTYLQMRKSSLGMEALEEIGKKNIDGFVSGKL